MKTKIMETKDFVAIRQAINSSTPNDLIVFDVDEVLLTPRDQILQHKTYANEKLGAIAQQVDLPEFWNLMGVVA